MTKVIELALERIGDLWPEWSRSRHKTRQKIFEAIALNVHIILQFGTQEDKDTLFHYVEVSRDKFKKDLAKEFPKHRKKILSDVKKCA